MPLYSIGQQLEKVGDGIWTLMATPAKALCDRQLLTRRLPPLSRRSMERFLQKELRIDEEDLLGLDQQVVRECLATGIKHHQLQT